MIINAVFKEASNNTDVSKVDDIEGYYKTFFAWFECEICD